MIHNGKDGHIRWKGASVILIRQKKMNGERGNNIQTQHAVVKVTGGVIHTNMIKT